ncbi:hypothetical protein TcCL_Unassigned01985 [Trypanosoma cruzi]|nr:hypothetical protein TcCL_Unassigned01985 [Trypanosoma cruzi]
MGSVPFRGAGLWLCIISPQQGVAASTTETKTTPPLEKVPRHARYGEVRRSACRLSDRTARPFRCGHSVDITRGGDVHKNHCPRRMATSLFGGLTLQASRP